MADRIHTKVVTCSKGFMVPFAVMGHISCGSFQWVISLESNTPCVKGFQ